MSIGTLVRVPVLVRKELPDQTLDTVEKEITSAEERLQQQMLECKFGQKLYFRKHNAYYADIDNFDGVLLGQKSGTSEPNWGTILPEIDKTTITIWDSAKLIELLSMPIGSPIELTSEEADEIVRLAAGRRPDLPAGKDYEKEVRELLGHSLLDRLEKAE